MSFLEYLTVIVGFFAVVGVIGLAGALLSALIERHISKENDNGQPH